MNIYVYRKSDGVRIHSYSNDYGVVPAVGTSLELFPNSHSMTPNTYTIVSVVHRPQHHEIRLIVE